MNESKQRINDNPIRINISVNHLQEYLMKKIATLALAFAMALGLAACGDHAPKQDSSSYTKGQ